MRKVFDDHASVQQGGERFMTHRDFTHAISFAHHANTRGTPPPPSRPMLGKLSGMPSPGVPTPAPVADEPRLRRLKRLLELADTTSSGLIDFHEFVALDVLLSKPDASIEVAFRLLDNDRSGTISKSELEKLWATLLPGESIPPEILSLVAHGREIGLEEFKIELAHALPPEFRSDVRGMVQEWRTVELAATHDARDLISIDGDRDEDVLVKDEEVAPEPSNRE